MLANEDPVEKQWIAVTFVTNNTFLGTARGRFKNISLHVDELLK